MCETKNLIRFELLMDAGNGAQKAGDILIKSFAAAGKYVYIEPMIPAEISPPPRTKNSLSGVIIRLANWDITNIGNDTDVMLAEHEILLDRRLEDGESNPNCIVLLDMGLQARNKETYDAVLEKVRVANLRLIPFELDAESAGMIRELKGHGRNMFYLGMLSAIFNADLDGLQSLISKTFKFNPDSLQKNLKIFTNGLAYAQANIDISYQIPAGPREQDMMLLDGNMALSLGIIDSGIKLFSGYPITPASSIMHTLAKLFPSYGGVVHQAEDEISAIGTVVGSYYAGVPAITATSGPGFSLKQEFIGLATASETPLICIDVQRGGPSTGLPTKTEQSDLLAAIYGSHGDNAKVVIGVSNVRDCFYAPHIARYLTEKLRVPVMIMSDYQISVSYKVLEKLPLNEMTSVDDIGQYVFDRFFMNPLPEGIEMVKDNQSVPGQDGQMRRVTGLNTDQEGQITYTSDSSVRAHSIRNEKLHHVARSLRTPEMFGHTAGGEVLVVGWGSSRGAIEEAISMAAAEGLPVAGLHLKIVYPLSLELQEIFSRFKKVVTVEVAYGDALKSAPLAMLLRDETLVDIKSLIAEPSGRPLKPRKILNLVKEIL